MDSLLWSNKKEGRVSKNPKVKRKWYSWSILSLLVPFSLSFSVSQYSMSGADYRYCSLWKSINGGELFKWLLEAFLRYLALKISINIDVYSKTGHNVGFLQCWKRRESVQASVHHVAASDAEFKIPGIVARRWSDACQIKNHFSVGLTTCTCRNAVQQGRWQVWPTCLGIDAEHCAAARVLSIGVHCMHFSFFWHRARRG
jgi:hypothetical protein